MPDTIEPQRKRGRPKGTKNSEPKGISLAKRLKILQKIILDPTEKTSSRLNAIKLLTDILSDRVKDPVQDAQKTIIKFSEDIPKKSNIIEIKPSEKQESPIQNTPIPETNNTNSTETTDIQGFIKEVDFKFIINPLESNE